MRQKLRAIRITLGLSQSQLARLSGVPRHKICTFELGDGTLDPDQEVRLRNAVQTETNRLRNLAVEIDFVELISAAEPRRKG